jgi:hypothetical protein
LVLSKNSTVTKLGVLTAINIVFTVILLIRFY